MKTLGIVGSKRKSGNTYNLVRKVLEGAASLGAETELIFLSDYKLLGCTGCEACKKNPFNCRIDDDLPKIKDLLQEAQGIVLGSPTYWYNVTADMKNLIDRLYSLIIFPEDDRSVWASAFDGRGKCGIGVVVCEQEDEKMMGFTMEAMTRALNDLDIKVSDVVKAIGYFKSAEVLQDKELMDRAEIAGQRLVRNIRLKEKARILRG